MKKGRLMMKYKEFISAVCKDVRGYLPERYKTVLIEPTHNEIQGISHYGISIRENPESNAIAFDLFPWFSQVCEESSLSYITALKQISVVIQEAPSCLPDENYTDLKRFLTFQVVSKKRNNKLLRALPHTDYLDVSVIYRFETPEWSLLVTDDRLKSYGLSIEQLHADAMENSPVRFPAHMQKLKECLVNCALESGDAQRMRELSAIPDCGMYVATCENGYGASVLFYPAFLEQAAKKFDGKFFILPSSTYEVILAPDRGRMTNIKALKGAVADINSNPEAVSPEDVLSDSVYHYDAKHHKLTKL